MLCKNINTVAMLTCDALLHHFRRGCITAGIGRCTLLSLTYSCLQPIGLAFGRLKTMASAWFQVSQWQSHTCEPYTTGEYIRTCVIFLLKC